MNRRDFLKATAIATAGTPFWMGTLIDKLWGKLPSNITITEVRPIFVTNTLYVKVFTDKGVTGLGSSSLPSLDRALEGAVKDVGALLVGKDPTNIEFLWQAAFRWPRQRGGPVQGAAISALEIALWDILGKLLDAPIYKLLGGAARDRIRLYDHSYAKTPEEMGEQVLKSKQEGFTAVRTGLAWTNSKVMSRPWDLKLAVRYVEAVRKAVGDDVDVIDDAHGLMTAVMALEYCKAVEPYRLLFIEDPVKEEDIAGLRFVQGHTSVPIAIGESIYTKFSYFREIIFNHLANYVRPDVIWTGGISECRKIAAMAEANFIDVCLHGGFDPVSSLAMTHISASTPNCVIQECGSRLGRRRPQWLVDLFHGNDMIIEKGYAKLPEGPGLGCDLDEALAKKFPFNPGTRPHMTTEDGAVMDW
jgi:galactonate dehydratase